MRKRKLRVGLVLGGVVLSASVLVYGCGDSPKERLRVASLSESCLINSDCASPLVCAFKRCHDACETSRDCPPGQRCLASDRPFHVCQLPDETECVYHSDCPNPLVCGPDAECRDQCTSPRDCLDGQTCTQRTCADEEELVDGKLPEAETEFEPDVPCTYSSECPEPLVCRQGSCRSECQTDRDCPSGSACKAAVCETVDPDPDPDPGLPEHCGNSQTDSDESDVDCGGSCRPCEPGGNCGEDQDCNSQNCLESSCQVPTCGDGVRNGAEQGQDCGGPSCDACTAVPECEESGDCGDDLICKQGQCRATTCANGALDPLETSIDCGGPDCAPCDHNSRCVTDGDCLSLNCTLGVCSPPNCNDGVQNGSESGVDCGGPECGQCANGVSCVDDADCASGVCGAEQCEAPSCDDGVMNGYETAEDCGGVECDACASGEACVSDNDCAVGKCLGDICRGQVTLTVATAGTGSGTVKSNDTAISCGTTCSHTYTEGANVALSINLAADSVFTGWSGACSGRGACVVAMAGDQQVTATFDLRAAQTGSILDIAGDSTVITPGGMAIDSTGENLVVGGRIGGTAVDFGLGPISGGSSTDGFLAKYSSTGELAWARSLGDTPSKLIEDVMLTPTGDVIGLGYLPSGGNASFGGGPLSCLVGSIGLLKVDGATGAHLASKCIGGGSYSNFYSGGEGGAGHRLVKNVNATPMFGVPFSGSNVDFGGIPLTGNGSYAWAFGKLSTSDLSVEAAVVVDSNTSGPSRLYDIAPDLSDGGLVAAGTCHGFDISASVPGERAVQGGAEVCVLKLDASLNLEWARVFGSALDDSARAVAVDDAGDVLVAGSFKSILYFGGTGITPAQSQGDPDGFLVKLDGDDGAPIWASKWGGLGSEIATALAVEVNTQAVGVFLVSSYGGGIDFGSATVSGSGLTFVLFDTDGNYVRGINSFPAPSSHAVQLIAKPAGGFWLHGQGLTTNQVDPFGVQGTASYTFAISLD